MRELLTRVVGRPRYLVAAMVLDVVVCGWVYAAIEDKGPVEGPWWGLVTGTTTGYGDFYPSTTAGRGVAAFLMVSMILLTACLTAQITAHLLPDPNVFTHDEQELIKDRLLAVEAKLDALLAQQGVDPARRGP